MKKFDREMKLHRAGWTRHPHEGSYVAPDGAQFDTLEAAEEHQSHREHAVFATLADHSKVRASDPGTWDRAQYEWKKMDDDRLAGLHPDVRHFEVRSMGDPSYKDLPVSMGRSTPLLKSRGFKRVEDAAKKAWLLWQGDKTPYGRGQGTGGWFYWHNGRPACQGREALAKLALDRQLVVEGVDGKWYPAVSEL